VLSVASLTQGPGYYLELANINYYIEGGEPLPLWHGTAALELGLSGIAQREHVERLCNGFHHESEKALVRNAGQESRNAGHDLTFSCPKSVSVAWATADTLMRKAIETQQLNAVRQALDFIESKAGFARVGSQGQQTVKTPLLFALFEHGTSRASDPQLHTHAICINLTVHLDGRTTAVDSTHLYHWKMAAGAIYRAALARGMQQIGFEVEQRRVGSSIGFELTAIPKSLAEEFSKRRAEIEEQLMIRAGSLDAASPKYAELLAKETRRTKDTEKPRMELLAEWQEVGKSYGVDHTFIQEQRIRHSFPSPADLEIRKEIIFVQAIDALSEHNAHWNEADLTKAVAERSAGLIDARDVQELIAIKLDSSELIRLGALTTDGKRQNPNRYIDRTEERYTTPEIQKLEREMLKDVSRILHNPANETDPDLVLKAVNIPGKTLDEEQAHGVDWLCSGPAIRLMSGLAGTGKTYTLKTCHEVWTEEGREVWGCAIAAAAANRLQEGTGIESGTLDRLLVYLDAGRVELHSKSVVVLDEAGMVGTKHMARLVKHIADAGSRLVLIGDAKQLQPVTAGGPFKYLSDILGEAKLGNIRRQEEKWARDAVKDFEQGRSREAIEAYVEHGHFHIAQNRPQAMAQLVDQWKIDGGISQPDRVFMLASLNSEVRELNLRAQAERISAGLVNPEQKIHANGVNFYEGDRLQFQRNSKELGVSNSDSGTILSVEPSRNRLTVKLDQDGREIAVSLKRYSPENIRLGYASTTHKAQGASIPFVHVLIGGPLTDLHMGYVQASRSQKGTHLFCDKDSAGPELNDLVRSLGRERQKTLAQEVIDQRQQKAPQQPHHLDPGPDAPRHDHPRGPSLGP